MYLVEKMGTVHLQKNKMLFAHALKQYGNDGKSSKL